jgi:heptosyltransferase-2
MLRREGYDTAFVLKRSFSSALLALLSGIPERIGFNTEFRGFLLTRRVPYHKGRYERDCFLDLLRAVDIPVADTRLESWWNKEEEAEVQKWMASYKDNPNVVLHVTSSNRAKNWSLEKFARLANHFLREVDSDNGTHLHMLGASRDANTVESLRQRQS